MVYHCSGACLLGEGTMQGVPSVAKVLATENAPAEWKCSDRLTAASSGSSQIDCKEEPIP